MNFLRHVGKIGDRKVAVIFREVPNEPHMCLVTYTETLNQHIHEAVINCIESQIGQSSENLADALNRTHTKDGKYVLQLLHKENLLKKVQTSQVIMTPNPKTTIKLDELNKILNEMQQGEQAVKRLAEINTGSDQSTMEVVKQMRPEQTAPVVATSGDVLGDSVLANNLKQHAARMEAEAKGLLAESARLHKEAAEILGIKPEVTTATTIAPTAKKRGRPAKATTPA